MKLVHNVSTSAQMWPADAYLGPVIEIVEGRWYFAGNKLQGDDTAAHTWSNMGNWVLSYQSQFCSHTQSWCNVTIQRDYATEYSKNMHSHALPAVMMYAIQQAHIQSSYDMFVRSCRCTMSGQRMQCVIVEITPFILRVPEG